jgi:hypothetical protein
MASNFLFGVDVTPSPMIGIIGDFYINTDTKFVWVKKIDGWKMYGILSNYIKDSSISGSISSGSVLSLSGIILQISDLLNDFWGWIKVQDGQTIALIALIILFAIVYLLD